MSATSLLGTTYSSGVFISQTSRQRSPEELAERGEKLGPHRYGKEYLGHLLARLPDAFAPANLDVWIDRREVSAGDVFEPVVCLALVRCSAAVFLVDRDALTSGYMQEEARLIGWRKVLEPDLVVLPVLLGDVSANDFATSPLGQTGGLGALSVLTPTNRKHNRAAAEQTAKEIAAGVRLEPLTPRAARWVDAVAHFLAPAPRGVLAEAAHRLGISEDNLRARRDVHAIVAAALLNSDLRAAFQVMRTVAEYLPEESLKQAKRRVIPLWVDLDHARTLMSLADVAPDRRIVHLVAGEVLPAEHAVLRAGASQDNVRADAFGGGVAGEEMVDELVARFDDKLRTLLSLHPHDGPDDVRDYLARDDTIAFALWNCDGVPAPVVRGVLHDLIGRFPGVVHALVSAKGVPARRKIRGARIVLSEDERTDRQTLHLIQEIRRLSTDAVGIDVD
jgi:hypothetical protein